MKIVCIADTHNQHKKLQNIPDGDVILHAGDVSGRGYHHEVRNFCDWYLKLPHKYKLLVAGNHDFFFQTNGHSEPLLRDVMPEPIIYLKDSMIEIEGIKIWGSPISPTFYNWAFMADRGKEIAEYWKQIPSGMDIVITHGPPHGILDECQDGHVGCEELTKYIKKAKPKYHVFGHIHEGYGIVKKGKTTYINASVLDGDYYMTNEPITIEI